MTGQEHADEAKRLMLQAAEAYRQGSHVRATFLQRDAQVHATLALAAAVGRPPVINHDADGHIEGIDEAALTRALRELDRREGRRR